MTTLRVGLLEFGARGANQDNRAVLKLLPSFAQQIEALGYTRLWLAEHHDPSCAWSTPEIPLTLAASATSRLKLGTGGILFSTRNPLRVALDFALLAGLYPDRIELGLARGTAGPNQVGLLEPSLEAMVTAEVFERNVVTLLTYLCGSPRRQSRYKDAVVLPALTDHVPVWLLGSGHTTAEMSHRIGIAYAHSLFHRLPIAPVASTKFDPRHHFRSRRRDAGAMIAVSGICTDDARTARQHAEAHANAHINIGIVGRAKEVASYIRSCARDFGVDDVLYLDLAPTLQERTEAAALLSEELRLASHLP